MSSRNESPGRRREPSRGARIYVGNLPTRYEKRDIEDLFTKFGRIVDLSVKRTISGGPFAFIEFEDLRDADDAIKGRDGYEIDGMRLRVEIPFDARGGNPRDRSRAGPPRRGEYRVTVEGLPPSGSWQDLKDHMREAGECVYADVFRDGTGAVEFSRREDADEAVRLLDGSKFKSHEGEVSRVTVKRAESSSGGGGGGGAISGSRTRGRSRSPGYQQSSSYDRCDRRSSYHGAGGGGGYSASYGDRREYGGGAGGGGGGGHSYRGRSASRSRTPPRHYTRSRSPRR